MLPGTHYSADRIALLLRRRTGMLVVLTLVGLGAAVAISFKLPNWYRSETLIMLEPQRIPDEYVKSISPTRDDGRTLNLENQIRSRSRLERIIDELNLYPSLRERSTMDDVLARMNDDITVEADKGTVRVAYVSRDPQLAQRVADRLSSTFIAENMRDREVLADQTNGFLNVQLDEAKRQLVEHEKKLEAYRTQFGNEMPSQATTNLGGMQNAQTQLQASLDASDRARERRLLLERQLADLQSEPLIEDPKTAVKTTEDELDEARTQLQELLARAKPDHPDVKSLQRKIRDLQAKLDAEDAQAGRGGTGTTRRQRRPSTAEIQRQRRAKDLTDQISDLDRQLADRQKQEAKFRGVIGDYQGKLNAIPKRESELIELSRDYATLQATYQSLLTKRQDARIAADLERRNIGPQYKILDAPKVPERPFSPNRPLIDAGGAAGGLLLGLLFIAIGEYRDSTFKREEDVERLFNIPVLAIVPEIDPPPARRRRFAVSVAVVVITGAIVFWTEHLLQLYYLK